MKSRSRSSHATAILVGLVIILVVIAGVLYASDRAQWAAEMAVNYVRFLAAPRGTLDVEVAQNPPPAAATPSSAPASVQGSDADWSSYNKTLTSDRFSSLDQINTTNASRLKVDCTFNTGEHTGFTSGLLEVDGALIFATEYDLFSINPATCQENWRTHEDYKPATPQNVNRGAAYLDGKLFRGTQDGRVIAYDARTGARIWQTSIADPKKGESVPAAPIAWNGLVFIGNAGGDMKGVKGRMYALDASSGKIVWEFYLVPKGAGDPTRGPEPPSPLDASTWANNAKPGIPITGGATWTSYTLDPDTGLLYVPGGNPAPDFDADVRQGSNRFTGSVVVLDAKTGAFRGDYEIEPKDWHDWDVSSAPAIIRTAGGRKLLSVTPKDGNLYGFDLASHSLLYRTPVTRVENAGEHFSVGKPVHFCPGTTGGDEWNGPAFDTQTNLIYVGEVDWCTTVTEQQAKKVAAAKPATPWSGEATINPYDTWGKSDPVFDWAGWLYAVDADTGAWRWRAKSNYPIQSGTTVTAGDVVFFGDMGGNFYALDARDGHKLWGRKIGGAIGGGVITYAVNGSQKVAVATGLTEVIWPSEITTAKVSVLGPG